MKKIVVILSLVLLLLFTVAQITMAQSEEKQTERIYSQMELVPVSGPESELVRKLVMHHEVTNQVSLFDSKGAESSFTVDNWGSVSYWRHSDPNACRLSVTAKARTTASTCVDETFAQAHACRTTGCLGWPDTSKNDGWGCNSDSGIAQNYTEAFVGDTIVNERYHQVIEGTTYSWSYSNPTVTLQCVP